VNRNSNIFWAALGIVFWCDNTNIGTFMFVLCFWQIYLNYKKDKKEENEKKSNSR